MAMNKNAIDMPDHSGDNTDIQFRRKRMDNVNGVIIVKRRESMPDDLDILYMDDIKHVWERRKALN